MISQFLLLLQFFATVYAFQNSYEVKQERFETEYFNPNLITIETGVYKYNRTTNSINVTFTLKVNITEKDTCVVKGYKWMSNQYRLDILQFEYTIKKVIGITYFDIDRLLRNKTNPSLIWPVQSNTCYKMRNWVPDSTQFPPGMPEGKWKIAISYVQADKTVITTINWYISLKYKVRYYDQN